MSLPIIFFQLLGYVYTFIGKEYYFMAQRKEPHNLDDYISPEEREHFLFGLHRYLVWVGEKIPDEVEVNGEIIKLRELIWRCIHKKQLSELEKKHILELVRILETKEEHDEEVLRKANLTHEEAKRLYDEDEIRKKVDDARRWIGFLRNIGKKPI